MSPPQPLRRRSSALRSSRISGGDDLTTPPPRLADPLLDQAVRSLAARLARLSPDPSRVAQRRDELRAFILRASPRINRPNFTHLDERDLQLLFTLTDLSFFAGGLAAVTRQAPGRSLAFRVSSRLTRAAGKTSSLQTPPSPGQPGSMRFEIAISATLLLESFHEPNAPPILVCGCPCGDRLDALMRVFEHEMIHLVEFAVWGRSSCARPRFRDLARRVFDHVGFHHDLVTPREAARRRHAIRIGDRVKFNYEGRTLRGRVSRITRRATVLVADPAGHLYSDGQHYIRYYVPVDRLQSDPS